MERLGRTKNTLLLRTHFGDDRAWRSLCAALRRKNEDGFRAHVTSVSDPQYAGVSPKRVLRLVSPQGHGFVLLADREALEGEERAVLVVDVADSPGRSFRVVPAHAWSVENNLSTGNMDFDELFDAAGSDGVFRGFEEVDAAPRKTRDDGLAELAPRDRAQALALRGDVDAALDAYLDLYARGDAAVSAALAALAVYRGERQEALRYAEATLRSPGSIATMNVYIDQLHIVAAAARELSAWGEVPRVAKLARAAAPRADRSSYIDRIEALEELAARAGRGYLFWWDEPKADAEERFRAAVEAQEKKRRKKKKPASATERTDHVYSLARVMGAHRAAVEIFDRERALPSVMFDDVVFLASGLARAGRDDEAWTAIRERLALWWPVEDTQIAPLELLTDPYLAPIVTGARRAAVLATPRGPQGPAGRG